MMRDVRGKCNVHCALAHLESFRANAVASAYVAISRAREGAAIYTDSRAKLTEALGLRDGAQVGAIDETMGREGRFGSRFAEPTSEV